LIDTKRNIAIFCNPRSGKGRALQVLPKLQSWLTTQSIQHTVFIDSLPNSLLGFSDMIVMGGDGSLQFLLNYFKSIAIPIGLIRCGTGNDLTNLLLGKAGYEKQFEIAVHGDIQPIDAGICNNTYFINGVGIGFDGWVVKRLVGKKWLSGKAAYYATVIRLLLFYKETNLTITANEHCITLPIFMVSAANGQTYGGGFKVAPNALVNDGLLELMMVHKISLLQRIRYLPVLEKGNHLNKSLQFITYLQTQKIRIQSATKLPAHLDGELIEATHFDIQILPNYLQIRAAFTKA
jgi:diacylglycerol kinase (ATP)